MHLIRLFLMAGSLLFTFCIAAPVSYAAQEVKATQLTNTSIPASHLAAAAARIDIYGEIPSDHHHKNGSTYHFAPGTNASIWVRAQIDKPLSPPDSSHSKRQYMDNYSGLAIGMWEGDNCEGYGAWTDNVEYNIDNNWEGPPGGLSTGIAERYMHNNEHLDYSTWNGNNFCGKYLYSAGWETPPGCWSSMNFYCYRLWHD